LWNNVFIEWLIIWRIYYVVVSFLIISKTNVRIYIFLIRVTLMPKIWSHIKFIHFKLNLKLSPKRVIIEILIWILDLVRICLQIKLYSHCEKDLQLFIYFQIVVPIIRKSIELIGIYCGQYNHWIHDNYEPKCINKTSP
jgi:hypothetical protein